MKPIILLVLLFLQFSLLSAELVTISGNQTGILFRNNYLVEEDIIVPANEQLIIENGCFLYFLEDKKIIVNGTLFCDGNENSPIIFTNETDDWSAPEWKGIHFTTESNSLSYVKFSQFRFAKTSIKIECNNCKITETEIKYSSDYGIEIDAEYVEILNCTLKNNQVGIIVQHKGCLIADCNICDNYLSGIVIEHTNSQIIRNICDNNTNNGLELIESNNNLIANNCFSNNYLNGIYLINSSAIIKDNIITENSDNGIMILESETSNITNNCISDNGYCGIYESQVTDISMERNAILNNLIAIKLIYSNQNTLKNNTIAENHTGLDIDENSEVNVNSTLICNNQIGVNINSNISNFEFNLIFNEVNIDGTNIPENFGVINSLNNNGVEADCYSNIFVDPEIQIIEFPEYLLTEFSPCIDAGSPKLSDDPDSTICDIGKNFFNQYSEILIGDVDGNNIVQAYDAFLVFEYLFNSVQILQAWQILAADFDQNGIVQANDASLILQSCLLQNLDVNNYSR